MFRLESNGGDKRSTMLFTNTLSTTRSYEVGLNPAGTSKDLWGVRDLTAVGAPTRFAIDSSGNVGIGTTTPLSTLHVDGSVSYKRTSTAGNYTILVSDYYVGVTSTAAARTITLPLATAAGEGKVYIIKDESGGAGTNNILIQGQGGDNVDGATVSITSNYGSIRVICDGGDWFTIE